MAKADRTGKRLPRSNARSRIPDLGYYFIVTDTEKTEENYLYGLWNSLPKELQGRIVIKVVEAPTNKLVEVCKQQASLRPQYAQCWIVFDRDQVERFDEIIRTAKREDVHVGWSNPCIEIWFDAYFGTMHTYHDSVKCCSSFANTYEKKTGQKYSKANRNIYDTLNRYGDESKAIEIAEAKLTKCRENEVRKPSEMCPCTTLHRLVKEIKGKTR